MAVWFTVENLRRHIVEGTDPRTDSVVFRYFRDTEVTKLEISILRDEDVLRLDIAMEDIPAFTENQCTAEILSEPDGVLLRDGIFKGFGQRCKEFHLDEDIPPDSVLFRDVVDIITVDDVGVAFHLRHDLIFAHDALEHRIEVLFYTSLVKSVAVQFFNFTVTFRNGDDLQRRRFRFAEELALNLIDGSETAGADLFNGLPAGK